jgi:O-antigen/teichoic acid export membrane protein
MSSLKKLAIRGTFWTVAGYGASQTLRFGSNLILTRLLTPDLFGLMALVYIFITGLHLFSDVGIGLSVIQNKRGDEPAFLNTIWTLQIIRGAILWGVCLLIAWPLSLIYEEPQLLWLIPIVGLINTLISGFVSPALYTLDRHMAVAQRTIIELATQVVSLVVMLIWAWFSPSIWALVAGSLVSTLLQLVWSHRLTPEKPSRFAWEKESVTEIFSMGQWIFLSTALTFLAEQADRLMLGKLFTLELLGIYTIALTLSDIPRQIALALSSKVIFPAVSKMIDLPRAEFRAKILRNRRYMVLALVLGVAILVSFGDQAILWLYDDRYRAAAWMLPILGLGIWPRLLCATSEPPLFALGTVQYTTFGNLCRLVFTIAAIAIGYTWFGILGAVVAVALNDLFYYVVVSYGLCREGLGCLTQDFQATGLLVGLIALCMLGRMFLGIGLPIDGWQASSSFLS